MEAGGVDVGRIFVGVLKSYSEERGWGHITCHETYGLYGKDMFVLKSAMEVVNIRVGDNVKFGIEQGRKGPQACNILPLNGDVSASVAQPQVLSSVSPAAPQGFSNNLTLPAANSQQFAKASGPQHIPAPSGFDSGFGGSMNGGFGMDRAPPTENLDILNWQSSSPNGNTQLALAATPTFEGAMDGQMPLMEFNGGQGMGISTDMMPATVNFVVHNASDPKARFLGLVKTFDDLKGWGHIECEASRQVYGKDIFLLRSALRGVPATINNQVEFAVIMSAKGPQARDVSLCDYGPEFHTLSRDVRPAPY